jgi:hypothetical protein
MFFCTPPSARAFSYARCWAVFYWAFFWKVTEQNKKSIFPGPICFFAPPRRGKLVLTQQGGGGGESRNGRLDAAASPPAEASCVSGATPIVWKEDSLVLMRSIHFFYSPDRIIIQTRALVKSWSSAATSPRPHKEAAG